MTGSAADERWGLDIGATSWRLCRRTGTEVELTASGTTGAEPAATIDAIRSTLQDLAGPVRLGCAFAGGLDGAGVVDGWPNRQSWVGFPLRRSLAEVCGRPVRVADDGVAAAIAVERSGWAGGRDAYLVTTWGTGLGGAVVVGDRVLEPSRVGGRTLGHLPGLDPSHRCRCGSLGCLQTAWTTLDTSGDLPWKQGIEVAERLVGLSQALGLEALVVVGGLLTRPPVKDLIRQVGQRHDFPVEIAPRPELAPVVGATYLEQAP